LYIFVAYTVLLTDYAAPQIILACSCQNVVKCFGFFEPAQLKRYTLVFERVDGGTVHDNLARLQQCSWQSPLNVCIGIARGLMSLHTNKVVHGDVKGGNVMLLRPVRPNELDISARDVSIIDFDTSFYAGPASKCENATLCKPRAVLYTTKFAAPEVLESRIACSTFASDVFAGAEPFAKLNDDAGK
jgi:serine/threonine protein kinase